MTTEAPESRSSPLQMPRRAVVTLGVLVGQIVKRRYFKTLRPPHCPGDDYGIAAMLCLIGIRANLP